MEEQTNDMPEGEYELLKLFRIFQETDEKYETLCFR